MGKSSRTFAHWIKMVVPTPQTQLHAARSAWYLSAFMNLNPYISISAFSLWIYIFYSIPFVYACPGFGMRAANVRSIHHYICLRRIRRMKQCNGALKLHPFHRQGGLDTKPSPSMGAFPNKLLVTLYPHLLSTPPPHRDPMVWEFDEKRARHSTAQLRIMERM